MNCINKLRTPPISLYIVLEYKSVKMKLVGTKEVDIMLKNRKGFTLIEIIVVIVILAVLMAVAVPSVMSYINEGNKAKYETIARAALINTQIAVSEDIAEDGKANDCLEVAKWVSNFESGGKTADYKRFGPKKSYGDNVTKIYLNHIYLTKNSDDLKSIVLYIRLKSDGIKYREVDVTVNGKITVASSSTATPHNPLIAIKYNQ